MSEAPVSNTPATTSSTTKVGNTTTNTPPEMLHPSGKLHLHSDANPNPAIQHPGANVAGADVPIPADRVVDDGPGELPVTHAQAALPSTLDLTRPFGSRSAGVNEFQIIQDGKVIGGGTLPAHESAVITNWLNGLRTPR